MTKKFSIIDNEYFNTGGNCMVNITTVYNSQYKTMQYVYINEEYLVVASYDYIRNELPTELEANDFVLIEISQENFTTEPSFDNRHMDVIDDDTALLLLDCMEAFIKGFVKHNRQHYFTTVDKLPNVLHKQVTDDYRHWLEERSQLVETDGEKIIVDSRYKAPAEADTPNGHAANDLLNCLAEEIKRMDTDDEKQLEEWYEEKLQIIYCGKLFTFANGADVFNGLEEFAKYVISEQ